MEEKQGLIIFLLFILFSPIYGQSNAPFGSGAKAIALGNTTTLSGEIYALFGNQAGLANAQNFSVAINSANYYSLNDLNHLGFGVLLPTNSGNFGLSVSQFGIDELKEQKIGIAYSKKLGKRFNAGIQFDYLNIQTDEFGNNGSFTFEGGIQAEISSEWKFGAHFFSPAKISVTNKQNIPTIIKIGTAFCPSPKARLIAELEKDISHPLRLNSGIEYFLNDRFIARIGIRSNPANFNFGIGTKLGKMVSLDLAFSYHQTLGFSPMLSVVYVSKK
jgi:hypothetical protein